MPSQTITVDVAELTEFIGATVENAMKRLLADSRKQRRREQLQAVETMFYPEDKQRRQDQLQRLETALYSYREDKQKQEHDPEAWSRVYGVELALRRIELLPFHEIIPLIYFEKLDRRSIAEKFFCDKTTICRHRRKLLDIMASTIHGI